MTSIVFSHQADIVISADEGGMVEYWTGEFVQDLQILDGFLFQEIARIMLFLRTLPSSPRYRISIYCCELDSCSSGGDRPVRVL